MLVTRLRLRLLVQEFDLKGPEVLIGRSPNCHLTIEDPMVSRVHSRIRIDEDRAFISDMQSRNGVRVNGKKIRGEVELQNTDRIRIGTREMVFTVLGKEERLSRTTGYLRMCEGCGTPFPDESVQCPHCGYRAITDEDTISGMFRESQQGWTVDLFCEVILRALDKGRDQDMQRMMRRLRTEIDERVRDGYRVSASDLSKIAHLVVGVVNHSGEEEWIGWLLSLCQKQSKFPRGELLRRVESIDLGNHPQLRPSVEAFRSWAHELSLKSTVASHGDKQSITTTGVIDTPLFDAG